MSNFKHKVDKKQIPVCNILGVNIAAIDMNWLLDFTDKHIKELSGDYMCLQCSYHCHIFRGQVLLRCAEWRNTSNS